MSFEESGFADRIKTFLVTSAGFLLDGYDLSVISFASIFIHKEFSLSTIE